MKRLANRMKVVMKSSIEMKGNAVFDYSKFILAIMVVAIHTRFLPKLLYPWLRLAVPLFFIMTGYFLFQKTAALNSPAEKNKRMLSFVERNLKLYFFWFLLLLPFVLYAKKWFYHGVVLGLAYFLRDLLFNGTFKASWYIMASVLAALLIYFLSRKISNKALLILTGCIYLVVCVWSSYSFLFDETETVKGFMGAYETIFAVPYNSFPVALFWIACGKCYADNDFGNLLSTRNKIIAVIIFSVLLYAEWRVVYTYSGSLNNDCYIMLAPLSMLVFSCLKNIEISSSQRALVLRKCSTIIYAMHGTVAGVLQTISEWFELGNDIVIFFSTILICISACYIILKLEKVKGFKWLKYSH